jgi:hypothetical protein
MIELAQRSPSSDWLAQLEWDLVTGEPPSQSALTRLMLLLGAGLPGQLVGDLAGVPANNLNLARAVAVTALVPETLLLPGDWPMTLQQAAQQARWRVLANFQAWCLEPLAWLALGEI